jgi:sRNA-binding carbon storage regulator CsrA
VFRKEVYLEIQQDRPREEDRKAVNEALDRLKGE